MVNDMTQHVVTVNGTKHYSGKKPEYYELNISRAIIVMVAYMVFIAPILTLLSVSVLGIGSAYIMPVFIILLLAGIYFTEKYCCRNIQ
jgi:hypothetical protein